MYWAIRFDQIINARQNLITSSCNDGIDVSLIDLISNNITREEFKQIKKQNPALFNPSNNDSFGENITSTERWITSIFTSWFLSFFLSSPIISFFMQIKNLLKYKYDKNKNKIDQMYYFSLYYHSV